MELGETYKEAATRELKEELGLSLPLQDLGQFKVCDQHGNCVHHLFHAVHFDTPLMANYAEVTEYRWGHPHTIAEDVASKPDLYAEPFKRALEFYLAVER